MVQSGVNASVSSISTVISPKVFPRGHQYLTEFSREVTSI
jgi:hypothetical protein